MAFRNIIIENPARVSVKNNQLIIETGKKHSIPIEDISSLLIENWQSSLTTAALSQLGERGCCVYVCDQKHMPCAVTIPFHQHSRETSMFQNQNSASEPLKKRMWQSVVKRKILNQATCLRIVGKDKVADYLTTLANTVRSGDSENVESTAAQAYFPELFYSGFYRGSESGYNSGLNYGYAILRGYVARSLAVYGFHPSLGIHHHSTLNAFNLADDLMEPYRPVIDLIVYMKLEDESELTPLVKRMILNCLNVDVLSDGKHYSLSYSIDRMVQSFSRSLGEKKVLLKLPHLIGLNMHRYE